MRIAWTTALIGTAAALASCASGGSAPSTSAVAAVTAEGLYEYTANLPGHQVRGTMRVLGDTIIVMPANEYCRPVIGPADPLVLRYTCTGGGTYEQLNLAIDRRNPMQLSRWTATYRVQARREVCAQYEIRAGRQVCVSTRTETYETTQSRSGTLQVRRQP